ncbi:MAG: transcriptional regulator, AsnC family [Marmoricola sp.]|nr:transcriptional regulator, AsnC family [Marmoricola sp.]
MGMIKGEPADSPSTAAGALYRRPPRSQISDVDKAIIGALQQDGRRAYAEIGEPLGLGAEQVESRVARLVEAGVIQITAVSDPLQLGFARQAMLGVNVEGRTAAAVAKDLAEVPELVYVVVTAGGFDVMVEVVGDSDAHLLELVTTRVKPVPGVSAVHTFLYLELQKQTYTWGVR